MGAVTFLGIVIVGAAFLAALTVGRLPPPLEVWVPVAPTVPELDFWIRSLTNTSVSVPATPSSELPLVP